MKSIWKKVWFIAPSLLIFDMGFCSAASYISFLDGKKEQGFDYLLMLFIAIFLYIIRYDNRSKS